MKRKAALEVKVNRRLRRLAGALRMVLACYKVRKD